MPPLLAIVIAFMTQRVLLSLGLAVLVGGLLTQGHSLVQGIGPWFLGLRTGLGFVTQTLPFVSETHRFQIPENLVILGFIFVIFAMVELLIASGGFNGVIRLLLRWIRGKRSAEFMCALLGVGCFIDDYTNAIIVGSAMRPITDRHGVSREKLAFIVDATSAPIAGLAVISTWIAYEVGLFSDIAQQLGIDQSGYALFFDALRFRFYCVFMILFVFLLILIGRDFGPMKQSKLKIKDQKPKLPHRGPADANGMQDPANDPAKNVLSLDGRARSALVPLMGLMGFHLTALWVAGGGWAKIQAGQSLLDWVHWRQTLSDVPSSSRILLYSSSVGLLLAVLCAGLWTAIPPGHMVRALGRGLRKGLLPAALLILAWSMKNCCNQLHTGGFLASVLVDTVSPLWFPPLVFIVASVTSFATGTSYGTMAILIPTAIPVAFHLDGQFYGLITMISLGAVLDGAIFGDHCSPISDTTILSSISSQCILIRHVKTQLPYSLSVAAIALVVGYLPGTQGLSWLWSITLAAAIMMALFVWLRLRTT